MTVEQLQDPETCQGCHPAHYREWASSMHAYAARDPVFTAMNERGQRETGGALGEFCVRCHAPMALELGLTQDGLNLPDLAAEPSARGVTCYFCHDVSAVEGDHNRALVLAGDALMRGGLGAGEHAGDEGNARAPVGNAAHASAYSPLHDRTQRDSARLCGACHDVVNPQDVPIERTFHEWQGSRFAAKGEGLETCASCHMARYRGKAAPDAPQRTLHRHLWPGVDVALEPTFPDVDAQRRAITCAFEGAIELELAPVVNSPPFDQFEVTLTNLRVGHAWPSGAAQDRRAWVELIAYGDDDQPFFERGVVPQGDVVGAGDDQLEVLRDRLYDESGEPVHMFWQAAPSSTHELGYETHLLPAPTDADAAPSRILRFTLPTPAARVTARLLVQSIGLDVLDDFNGLPLPVTERVLMSGGYRQGATLRSRVPTITVPGSEREWDASDPGAARPAGEPSSSEACEPPPFGSDS